MAITSTRRYKTHGYCDPKMSKTLTKIIANKVVVNIVAGGVWISAYKMFHIWCNTDNIIARIRNTIFTSLLIASNDIYIRWKEWTSLVLIMFTFHCCTRAYVSQVCLCVLDGKRQLVEWKKKCLCEKYIMWKLLKITGSCLTDFI